MRYYEIIGEIWRLLQPGSFNDAEGFEVRNSKGRPPGFSKDAKIMNESGIPANELIARFPYLSADIKEIEDWMNLDESELTFQFINRPMRVFAGAAQRQIKEYKNVELGSWTKEQARIIKIIRLLEQGEPQWPIFVDATKTMTTISHLGYVMEGHHRLCASYILKKPTIPVVYVSFAT